MTPTESINLRNALATAAAYLGVAQTSEDPIAVRQMLTEVLAAVGRAYEATFEGPTP